MQFIQLQPQNSSNLPSSSVGSLNLFVDSANDQLAFKDDNGQVVVAGGGGGAGFPYTGSAVITGSLEMIGVTTLVNPSIGPKVNFVKTPYSSSQIDIIEAGVTEIARGDNQGIYNAAAEGSYSYNLSPSGTLWNSIYTDPVNYGWGNLQSIPYRTFSDWQAAVDNNAGNNITDLPMVMQDTNTGKYYLVKFYQWTAGGNGGGFSYDRYEVALPVSTSFTKPNYSTSTQDTISPGLVIARGDNKGIYNSVLESVYDDNAYQSPIGTRWNSIYTDPVNYGWGNLSNVKNRVYNSWNNALNQAVGNYIVGLEMVMHDTTEDKYYMVKFTQWTQNNAGGGFSYDRTPINLSEGIVFEDGTQQTTAYDPSSVVIKSLQNTIYSNFPTAGPNFSSDNSIYLGQQAGYSASSAYGSNFLGQQAGYSAINAYQSNFLGSSAGYGATNANGSNFLGYYAGYQANTAYLSNFLGSQAGQSATDAHGSNFLGFQAGASATNAYFSNFIGYGAGSQATNANDSNFFGYQAGVNATSANDSNFLGLNAGQQATNAAYSNFLGLTTGQFATNASDSNFLGRAAGQSATNAQYSNFFGLTAGQFATNAYGSNFFGLGTGYQAYSASYSNFFGFGAGSEATNASHSILIGYHAGDNYNSLSSIGPNNIVIGTNITLPTSASNAINIGGVVFGTGSYSTTTGNPYSGSANGKIGINQPNPQYSLDVSGSIGLSDLFTLAINNPLPSSNVPSASLMASGSGANLKPYFWNGATWTALF